MKPLASRRRMLLITVVLIQLVPAIQSHADGTKNAPKNILLIVSDDLKASALGCYGNTLCKTPNIDRLAKRGMVFDRAYCQGTWCLPSRQSFMFSRYLGSPKLANHPSVAQHFKNNGYYSARVGKIFHMRVPGDIIAGTNGPDHEPSWIERFNCPGPEAHTPGRYSLLNKNVFTRKEEGRESTGDKHRMFVAVEADDEGESQPDHKAAEKASELIRDKKSEPFFLAVGFVRPHYPMVAPERFFANYPINKISLPEAVPNDLDDIPAQGRGQTLSSQCGIDAFPENQKRMWAAYYASVEFMDVQVGKILDELEKHKLLDSTIIVFTSDHGYHLGEHSFWQKSDLHEEVTRVPMIVSVPGMKPGHTNALCELVDIYPTLIELASLDRPLNVQGKSFANVVGNSTARHRVTAMSQLRKAISIRTDKWAYISYGPDIEELYDMNSDPKQFHNVAHQAKHHQVLVRHRILADQRRAELKSD